MDALMPPQARTHLGLQMTAASTDDGLQLQSCAHCATVQYPPREVCVNCLSDDLSWQAVESKGKVLASSLLQHSLDPWFAARTPVLVGSVKLDCGPVAIAHLAADVAAKDSAVWIMSVKDPSGQAVLVATSQQLAIEQAANDARQLVMQPPKEQA